MHPSLHPAQFLECLSEFGRHDKLTLTPSYFRLTATFCEYMNFVTIDRNVQCLTKLTGQLAVLAVYASMIFIPDDLSELPSSGGAARSAIVILKERKLIVRKLITHSKQRGPIFGG